MEDVEMAKEGSHISKVPKTTLRGYSGNFFSKTAKYQVVAYPHSYKGPGDTSFDKSSKYRHKDHFQRIYKGSLDERFLDPVTGKVKELIVQCVDNVYNGPQNSTYKRTFIRNVSPLTLRLANWPMSRFDEEEERKETEEKEVKPKSLKRMLSSFELLVKWPISCFLLYPVVAIPSFTSTGQIVNQGGYDPFPYRYWGYCKVSRNALERKVLKSSHGASLNSAITSSSLNMDRILEPRTLCFDTGQDQAQTQQVEEWKKNPQNSSPHKKCPEYVFVAYTRSQFPDSLECQIAIHAIGLKAARDAKVPAYWLDVACINADDKDNDIYRISDIVRGAHSLVVAIATPPETPPHGQSEGERVEFLLRQWGERVWTFPEVLLCRNESLKVYERDKDEAIKIMPKNRLAANCWNDPESSRQLLDHFAGNLNLTPLQLIIIALECLFTRKGKYYEGDQSYVLMGLLLKRPRIDRQDSAFQAFARLSLANDSDKVLERLMCLLPEDHSQEWHCVSDGYGVNLWDIEPTCQIAGICDDDTVLIDGAFGATIHWDRFRKVNSRRAASATRIFTQILLHGAPCFLVVGAILWGTTNDVYGLLNGLDDDLTTINNLETHIKDKVKDVVDLSSYVVGKKTLGKVNSLLDWTYFFWAISILLLFTAIAVFVSSPYLTRLLYRGKFWGSQAWLFGFEGYADIKTIESQIFGARLNRLRWSPYGSSLSRHDPDGSGECEGQDPKQDPVVREKIEEAERNGSSGELRIFTLVDTNTMTVTLFEAVRPPTVLLLCAAEGGMQRAIACSYEWSTGTCRRETILRMETPVLEKMSRVSRVKLGVIRK
ncbi:hypothetical protein N7494_010425 [Penicillium frequentans]|uniref:Heterokaryon incompatibility domain-containing protein n=1 Tax=Penicillium frequentans TaxID=3151616 RepID=A0AAD6G9R9_9EURO|nr:hypothetical protein N7494_010425 [Penicillium glabrum]